MSGEQERLFVAESLETMIKRKKNWILDSNVDNIKKSAEFYSFEGRTGFGIFWVFFGIYS